jgi:hypothetical protein
MKPQEALKAIDALIEETHAALLATSDCSHHPSMRWVSPCMLKSVPGSVFVLSLPDATKIEHIRKNPLVQWSFQSRTLDKIIIANATATIHHNIALTSELLECLGRRLQTFWSLTPDSHAPLVVIETVLTDSTLFSPANGERTRVTFNREQQP